MSELGVPPELGRKLGLTECFHYPQRKNLASERASARQARRCSVSLPRYEEQEHPANFPPRSFFGAHISQTSRKSALICQSRWAFGRPGSSHFWHAKQILSDSDYTSTSRRLLVFFFLLSDDGG